jgi:hypothetical protein
LVERSRIVELPRVDAFRLRISRREVLDDTFHLGLCDGRDVADISQDVAFERAREQLGILGARVLAENANGKIRIALGVLDAFEGRFQKSIDGLRAASDE